MDPRMRPQELEKAYREAYGVALPGRLVEAYALLGEAVYFGIRDRGDDDSGKRRPRNQRRDYWFADWGLFRAKEAVDRVLAKASLALRNTRRSEQAPAGPRSRDLGATAKPGAVAPSSQAKEA